VAMPVAQASSRSGTGSFIESLSHATR
jgi:hypothetical protein